MKIFNRTLNPRDQQGVVLFIALIVLVAMTLAGIAMVRQMTSGMAIAGNLAFKQNATSAADLGIEAARSWLLPYQLNPAPLSMSMPTSGYFSDWNSTFDPTTFNWSSSGQSFQVPGGDGAGNDVRYIIHRLCSLANIDVNGPGQQCVTLKVAGAGSTQSSLNYTDQALSNTVQPYFRITARAAGPRNTLSYIQIVMY